MISLSYLVQERIVLWKRPRAAFLCVQKRHTRRPGPECFEPYTQIPHEVFAASSGHAIVNRKALSSRASIVRKRTLQRQQMSCRQINHFVLHMHSDVACDSLD